jgi:hypothetical protein
MRATLDSPFHELIILSRRTVAPVLLDRFLSLRVRGMGRVQSLIRGVRLSNHSDHHATEKQRAVDHRSGCAGQR